MTRPGITRWLNDQPAVLVANPTAQSGKAAEFFDKVRAYLPTVDGAQIERDARIPDEVLRAMAELGAFGMKIDEKYGGLGLSHLHYAQALMLVGSASPSLAALLSAHQSIGVPQPLKMFGNEEQKRTYLPRVAAGLLRAGPAGGVIMAAPACAAGCTPVRPLPSHSI